MAEARATSEASSLTCVMVDAGPSLLYPHLGLSAGTPGHSMWPELPYSIFLVLLSWPLRAPKMSIPRKQSKS